MSRQQPALAPTRSLSILDLPDASGTTPGATPTAPSPAGRALSRGRDPGGISPASSFGGGRAASSLGGKPQRRPAKPLPHDGANPPRFPPDKGFSVPGPGTHDPLLSLTWNRRALYTWGRDDRQKYLGISNSVSTSSLCGPGAYNAGNDFTNRNVTNESVWGRGPTYGIFPGVPRLLERAGAPKDDSMRSNTEHGGAAAAAGGKDSSQTTSPASRSPTASRKTISLGLPEDDTAGAVASGSSSSSSSRAQTPDGGGPGSGGGGVLSSSPAPSKEVLGAGGGASSSSLGAGSRRRSSFSGKGPSSEEQRLAEAARKEDAKERAAEQRRHQKWTSSVKHFQALSAQSPLSQRDHYELTKLVSKPMFRDASLKAEKDRLKRLERERKGLGNRESYMLGVYQVRWPEKEQL